MRSNIDGGAAGVGRTAGRIDHAAAATVLRNENFVKGWYSAERLNNTFFSSAPARPFTTVVPDDVGRLLPGVQASPRGQPVAAPQDPVEGCLLIKDINTLLGRLEEHLDIRLSSHHALLQNVESQQHDILNILRHGGHGPAMLSEADSGHAGVVVGNHSGNSVHRHNQAGSVVRRGLVSHGRTNDSTILSTPVAEPPDTRHSKPSKPSGRSPAAFVSNDAELYIGDESEASIYWRKFENFVKGAKFDYFFGSIIVLNAIFLGVQLDIKARYVGNEGARLEPLYFQSIETVFAVTFLVELLMRMLVWRHRYFFSGWNWFDMFVVASAVFEEAIKYGIGGETVAGKLSVLKLGRIVKLARTFRVIRVIRAFRELRIVVMAIIYCLRALFSTLALLSVLFYVFAILILVELTSTAGSYNGDTKFGQLRKELYPNMPRVLLTLFKSITGGMQWDLATSALEDVLPYMVFMWIVFIGFSVFAIGNVVTGIFVQQAERVGMDDERNVLMEEKDLRQVVMANMRTMFHKADPENTGMLTRKRLEDSLLQRQSKSIFKKFDIDQRDVISFFDLVCDENGVVPLADIEVFLNGIFRLRGPAKNMDLVALTFQHHAFTREHRYDSNKIRTIASALTKRPGQ